MTKKKLHYCPCRLQGHTQRIVPSAINNLPFYFKKLEVSMRVYAAYRLISGWALYFTSCERVKKALDQRAKI